MDLFMQDTPKVTSGVTPQSRSIGYYLHSYLTCDWAELPTKVSCFSDLEQETSLEQVHSKNNQKWDRFILLAEYLNAQT